MSVHSWVPSVGFQKQQALCIILEVAMMRGSSIRPSNSRHLSAARYAAFVFILVANVIARMLAQSSEILREMSICLPVVKRSTNDM